MISKLFKLFTSCTTNTPMEEFTTEVLCGVLSSDQQLLDMYVNALLKIKGDGFRVETQKRYKPVNSVDSGSIVDMVFINHNTLIFQENKVDSYEGDSQLSKYSNVLLNEEVANRWLVYCTKFVDRKSQRDIEPLEYSNFRQLRWCEVYTFLENNINSNVLAHYFVNFLKEKGMSTPPEFNYEHLIALREIYSALQTMKECLEKVTPKFTELFGEPSTRDHAALKEIPHRNRYSLYRSGKNILLEGGYSELFVSFYLGGGYCEVTPALSVHIWVPKDHRFIKELKSEFESLEQHSSAKKEEAANGSMRVYWEKPLSDFISSSRQIYDITEWFREHMKYLKEYLCSSKFDWNVPGKDKTMTFL